ncbi:hypothetical protein ES703_26669 [subsurface metagenome]
MVAGRSNMNELISLNPRFLRSVHLERDFYAKDAVNGYLVTRGSLTALSLLARGASDPSYRAQSISGPYGSGKSALAMYFARLLGKTATNAAREEARGYLGEIGEQLLPPSDQGYIPILATGTRENLGTCLIENLKRSLERSGRNGLAQELLRKQRSVVRGTRTDARTLVELFEKLARLSVKEDRALGIIIIVDELGKLLEHAALQPEESDLHILQEMAEAASRSYEYPIWFITILHQEFSQYASRLGRRHQQEWSKVQQRFFDVPCTLDDTDALQLVATALNSSKKAMVCENAHIQEAARACAKLAPKGSEVEFQKVCVSSYPLHPITLLVLPALFKRFGQNERSLFSFLSADEPFSLSDWVQTQEFRTNDPPFVRLPQLYDYAYYTLIGGAPNPQFARMWTEVEDAINRLGNEAPEEIDVLKSIGLLGLVGDASRISASREVIQLALVSPSRSVQQVDNAIRSLESKRLVVFRRFRNAYRLWEGSDIDINERLAEAYQTLPPQSVTLAVARDLCPSSPLVTRRHSFHTGMLRFFAVMPSSKEGLLTATKMKENYDGCVVQCLVENDEEVEFVASIAQQLEDPSVIVLIGKENDELAESARDVAALEWVKKNTPSLAGDRVARQELSERRLEAEMAFRSEWNGIFEPSLNGCTCYWQGKEYSNLSTRRFASLLSDACDATFPYAPIVKNELINRRSLSSAATAARRNLIEAMISSSDKQGLGITGYPPQRSIYESLLLHSGIHRSTEMGTWIFDKPNDSDPGLQKAWDYILEAVDSSSLEPKSVVEIFGELSSAPYGVADGFVPVLFCAYLLANNITIALYEEGAFVPELSVPVLERLMRGPENFSVLKFELGGERSAVVERFALGFTVNNGVLPVVRSLYARIGSLPKYTLMARNLSPEAIAVRETILRAKSPERLLFIDLPTAVGFQPFQPSFNDSMNEDNVEAFFDSLNSVFSEFVGCYPKLLDYIRKGILDIFDIAEDESEWITKIQKRASRLYNAVFDSKLRAIMVRASDTQLGEIKYLESLAAGITGQPPNRWSQADEDNFARLVSQLASQVRTAESVQYLKSTLEDSEDGYLLTINDRQGEAIRQIIRFSRKERGEVERIARILSDQDSFSTNRHILLAAITEAARQLASPTATEE